MKWLALVLALVACEDDEELEPQYFTDMTDEDAAKRRAIESQFWACGAMVAHAP